MNKKQVKDFMALAEKAFEEQRHAEKEAERKEREPKCVGKCFLCDGDVMENKVCKFTGHGEPIIGPGGKGQYSFVVEGYYCDNCGLAYAKHPKKKEKK